jgi:glycosyltransferase involved in cell wall biosynthesis
MEQITVVPSGAALLDDVAVIVPVFNRRGLVLRTLDSVLDQSSLPGQLIIIDDGSSDGSATVVSDWIERQTSATRILFRAQANRGVSAARNAGFALAGAVRFVAFLDSDDCWPPDFLSRTQAALDKVDAAVAASTDRVYVGGSNAGDAGDLQSISTRWLLVNGGGVGSCTLLRAAAVRACGGYDEEIRSGADFKLFLEVSLTGAWIHASGAPTRMLRGYNLHGADAGNLSLAHPANWVTWATIASQFIARNSLRCGLTREEEAIVVREKWHAAAKSLVAAGMTRAACDAYEHALAPFEYLTSLSAARPARFTAQG